MQKDAEHNLNPIEWALSEYKADSSYWQDRAKNGTGLIKQIADFVIAGAHNQ